MSQSDSAHVCRVPADRQESAVAVDGVGSKYRRRRIKNLRCIVLRSTVLMHWSNRLLVFYSPQHVLARGPRFVNTLRRLVRPVEPTSWKIAYIPFCSWFLFFNRLQQNFLILWLWCIRNPVAIRLPGVRFMTGIQSQRDWQYTCKSQLFIRHIKQAVAADSYFKWWSNSSVKAWYIVLPLSSFDLLGLHV